MFLLRRSLTGLPRRYYEFESKDPRRDCVEPANARLLLIAQSDARELTLNAEEVSRIETVLRGPAAKAWALWSKAPLITKRCNRYWCRDDYTPLKYARNPNLTDEERAEDAARHAAEDAKRREQRRAVSEQQQQQTLSAAELEM
jgi:hypothetical protein